MRTFNQLSREPMTNVDTAWLRMDSSDNLMVINGLLFFDEPMTQDEFKALLEERLLSQHKRFRQRARNEHGVYFWEEMSGVDMDYHLTPLTLAATDDPEAELRRVVSTVIPQPLDSDKPLWRFHFISNYQSGSAVLVRVHHSYADGIALISVLDSIADQSVMHSSPAARFKLPERKPKSAALLHRLSYAFTSGGFYLAFGAAWLFEAMRVSLCRPDSKTAYKRDLSPHKEVGWAPSLPVEDVKQVGKAMGCTINDVILGCVAGSLRRYLQRIGEPVDGVCVRATIPVNLRPLEQALELGNRFGLVYLTLPVGEPTSKGRIEAVKRNMKKLKNGMQAQMSYNVLGILGYFPSAFERWALRFFSSKASAVMTNVPGPAEPVMLKGKKLSKPMFWVPQSGGIGIGVSILSYDNKVEFGFVADAALVPDPQAMIDDYVDEFRSIQAEVLGAPAFEEALSRAV
ncbi:wax ester/triacylglycerol synthase family O-acyltransferase [Ketobacter sp.]|uniref:wax ester/triacylglycerol synthase family O-acyltransferase n=1 Tax=Ketobacter sp. TaxID=2083498 RepID=UPI000F13EAA6|nr:wax ester/triacylglycerol synthase family O-acyltransferase [Ketobacter sp.]RLT94212.1 MAG: wax ester/triacylglycerol synthase family O-acyltransferase [Ketobacter sp.]